MKRKVLVGAVLLLAVAVLLWANLRQLGGEPAAGSGGAKVQGPKGAPVVKVETVTLRSLAQEVLSPGVVEAGGTQEMRAPFATKQVRLQVGIGDKVKKGQVLAELSAQELSAQVAQQEAQVVRAEATVATQRLQMQQSPTQLAQRLEQARAQLLQAQESLATASEKGDTLRTRLEQARASLEQLQERSNAGSAQVESARAALEQAETAYRANPLGAGLREAYEAAESAYEEALQQSEVSAHQAAADLRRAYDELESAEQEYARAGGENPVAVQVARSQAESARLAVQLAETEAASGGSAAAQVRSAEADLRSARMSLAMLEEKLSKASLRAPADGTILAVSLKDGQPAQEGQVILSLGDMNGMKVTARVDEIDIGKVKVGQPLSVRSNADLQSRFEGEVVRVSAQMAQPTQGATSSSSYFEVEGRVQNSDGLLRSGMNAEVTITAESRESVIVVGLASVREEGQEASVLVVEDFKVKLRPVKLGLRTQTEVEVLEGLKEGEELVVGPFTLINSLADQSPVRTEQVAGDQP